MQPGFGPGRESPTVASTRASTVATVTAKHTIATRRSRRVSLRRGVFVRFQCPSRGIAGTLIARAAAAYRHTGEIAGPIFGPVYVVTVSPSRQAARDLSTERNKGRWICTG